MLKVNEEKILADYKSILEKKSVKVAEIEAQVRPFAVSLGYDEEKTKGLIAYIQEQNGNGLSAEDTAKLEILSSYIDEVEEPVAESEVAEEVSFDALQSVGATE